MKEGTVKNSMIVKSYVEHDGEIFNWNKY
jgi:hypothetical protein